MNWQGVCCCFAAKIGSVLFKRVIVPDCHYFAELSDRLCPKASGRQQRSACKTLRIGSDVNGELMVCPSYRCFSWMSIKNPEIEGILSI